MDRISSGQRGPKNCQRSSNLNYDNSLRSSLGVGDAGNVREGCHQHCTYTTSEAFTGWGQDQEVKVEVTRHDDNGQQQTSSSSNQWRDKCILAACGITVATEQHNYEKWRNLHGNSKQSHNGQWLELSVNENTDVQSTWYTETNNPFSW